MTIKMCNEIAYHAKISKKLQSLGARWTIYPSLTSPTDELPAVPIVSHSPTPTLSGPSENHFHRFNTNANDLFIFHWQRYKFPKTFTKAIKQQIEFGIFKRVVAVKGLHPGHMSERDPAVQLLGN
jgi:hypothetical protein